MRILCIRGENLASLERFDIDLESGPLAHAGIFAITGPTGSGKTTLLDALCVALFDRTPRLSNVAGVPIGRAEQEDGQRVRANDVRGLLRRGAGEGFAEVDFIGRDRRSYRARWSVHRSRRRASGKLQKSEISLTDIDTGQQVASGKKEALEAIEERLGLNFEQFRRSALLAQNDFAAFLRADKEQRSELLERMTGTEIYTQVSVAAFRRASDEAKGLALLEEAVGANSILDDEARIALVTKRDGLRISFVEQEALLRAAEADSRWFAESRNAAVALANAQKALAKAEQEIVGLHATEERVAAVRCARDHRSVVVAVAQGRVLAEGTRTQELVAKEARAGEESTLAKNEAAVVLAKKEIERVREQYIKDLNSELHQLSSEAETLRVWLAGHTELKSAGGIAEDLEVLEIGELDESLPELQEILVHQLSAVAKAGKSVQEQDAKLVVVRAQSDKLAVQCEHVDLSLVREKNAAFRALVEQLSAVLSSQELEAHAKEEATSALKVIEGLSKAAHVLSEQEKKNAIMLAEAETAFDRVRIAMDLSDHREALTEGEACPLCGSCTHPWAENKAAVRAVGILETRVSELREIRERGQQAIAENSSSRREHEKAHKTYSDLMKTQGERAAEEMKQARMVVSESHLEDVCLRDDFEGLKETLEQLTKRVDATQRELRLAEALDGEYRDALAVVAEAQALWSKLVALRQEAELQGSVAQQHVSACQGYRYRARGSKLARCESSLAVCKEKLSGAPQWVPVGEEQTLAKAQDRAQVSKQGLAAATERLSACVSAATQAEKTLVEREANLREVLAKLETTEAEMCEKLGVSETWLQQAAEQLTTASRRQAETGATMRERELRCEELKQQRTPARDEKQTVLRKDKLAETLDSIREQGMSVGTELQTDEAARKRRDELGTRIEAATHRTRIFRTLSDLIGSADGKKFRVFAQSLTLESLLEGANIHLRALTPRYLLQRVPGYDLDIQIIDRDLADEVRSVNSLSGGESFLISLALALGLSSLASKDVRVESLLIDEGFGSLDGEALEVALSVLDSLQATGCKVGLISHVSGFAERIGVQVIVSPQGGGRSSVHVQGAAGGFG